MTVLFIFYLVIGDNSRWQVALGGMVVSALPLLLLLSKENPFNIPTVLGYYIFLFCTTYLGSIAGFYLQYPWWDTSIHLYKGIFIASVGITLYKILTPKQFQNEISRWILFLFTLGLAVAAGTIWEIYEFLGDQFVTDTMQRGGNTDTMIDLLAGMAGGLLIALYSVIRKQKV